MNKDTFDVVVIGAGPGGYVTAIRTSQLGLKTAIVEDNSVGGICLNWGCIPTKSMLVSADTYRLFKNAKHYGLSAKNISFDLEAIIKRSRGIANRLSKGVKFLLNKNSVITINGHAQLAGPTKINISKKNKIVHSVSTKHIVIATGARPKNIPGIEPDGHLIWSYFEALKPNCLPKSILIIGSGAIGIEFASFFHTLGVKILIVEMLDRILPNEDQEISLFARKNFEKSGIQILTSTKVKEIKKNSNDVLCLLESLGKKQQKIKVDRIISAVGIIGNTENIGIEKTKIKVDKGQITTNAFNQTDEPNIYAIGDVCGPPWLAHKAEHEAIVCAEIIAGGKSPPIKKLQIPSCTYCYPQIASIGLSETQAINSGFEIKIGRFPFAGNGKAVAMGEESGFIKTIFNKQTGQLLGAHMIGAEVTELIHGFAIAMGLETTEEDLINTIFPHPTLSEMMHESVLDAYDKAIHI